LQNYPRAWLADDVLAGLSACVVMIPSVLTLMAGVIAQLPIVALGTTDLQAR
jgi:MFS superfamily sulfate permease-like transporter